MSENKGKFKPVKGYKKFSGKLQMKGVREIQDGLIKPSLQLSTYLFAR